MAIDPGPIGLLTTALVLGIRHGIDWDHLAAIADITSTTAGTDAAEDTHRGEHGRDPDHAHPHGGPQELAAHHGPLPGHGPGAMLASRRVAAPLGHDRFAREQRHAILLGTLYALGHGLVVALLGGAALIFGALLPEWLDPVMSRIVGFTLVVLGVFVFVSLFRYARYGDDFRLRSRWMLVFAGIRHGWRSLQARLHGHEHAEPLEMSAYGARTAFLVGMIHGVGAETGTQVLLIAAIGGATGAGLGIPMMVAFIVGLLLSNSAIVVLTATGFVAGQARRRLYLAIGVLAGTFSLVVGSLFLFQGEAVLPNLFGLFRWIG